MTQEDKTMLALAALTYRGFGKHSERAIKQALLPWLPKLMREGLGKWDLVWGPASFRVPTSLVDDAMVYVAREDADRPRYVVAIRGTNPVSAFDWVFGDFWVSLQIPWDGLAATDARLSASSALGLEIIRHLAAEDPPSERSGLASFADALMDALDEFSAELPELEPQRLLKKLSDLPDSVLIERIQTNIRKEGTPFRSRVVGGLFRRFGGESVEQRLFDALIRHVAGVKDNGENLLTYLNRSVPEGAVVAVTGHSKGGALATVAALWLDEVWASARKVEIQCFSFAGPTAGNVAFTGRYNKRLAGRTRRIVNPRDAVPQAWVPDRFKSLATFYPALTPALDLVISSVASLNYAHVGGEVFEIESEPAGVNLAANLIHQHLDAYLQAAKFASRDWNALSIFTDS